MHANGNVTAKVWYSDSEKTPLNQVVSNKTGNTETKYSIRVNNFQKNFYKTLSKFEKYDTIEEMKKLKLFSQFYLPLEIIKKTNYELEEKVVEYTKEEAKNIAIERAKNNLNNQITNQENIQNTYINYNETDTFVEVQVIYEVLEEIGTKEKIVF